MVLQIEERSIEPGITVMSLAGKLSLGSECSRIESMIEDYAAGGNVHVILDMTGIEYIDSAGVGLVALAAGKLRQAGGRLVVVARPGRFLHLLQVTQIDRLVTVRATLQEATIAFSETQPPAAA